MNVAEGWEGWDEYAPFYDWENAQTLGRRDVPFWRRLTLTAGGPVLELGCGTGRVSRPLVKAGVDLIGVDRSPAMLRRARGFSRVRADIRALPFQNGAFPTVIAPYGVLQSLTRESDLADALATIARVTASGGTFGIDLLPDVPNWREYTNRVQFRGKAGRRHLMLVESVRQDRRRHLTTFSQTYIERRGGTKTEHTFDLTFRTLSVPQMIKRLDRAGFAVDRVLGDYDGGAWDAGALTWIIIATRV